MGNLELELALKYGIPLAVKLLSDGKGAKETELVVKEAVRNLVTSEVDFGKALAEASDEQADGIVEALFGLITGVAGAVGGLIKGIFGLLGGKK